MKRFSPLYAPEDGAGGGDAGAATAAAASTTTAAETSTGTAETATAAPGAATTEAATATAAAAYRPDGLPDHLYGASEKETIDKLFKAYGGAREAIAKAGEVPKDASAYAIEPSDKVKPYTEGLDKDPFWAKTRELALKHGIGARTFQGLFGDLLEAMVDQSLVAEPFSPEKEREALVPDVTDPKARAEAADKLIRENLALVTAWKEQGLPEASAAFLTATMDRAAANQLVEWIRDGRGETRPALTGTTASAATEAEFAKRMQDPRNELSSPKYDPAFAAETTRMARQIWGD